MTDSLSAQLSHLLESVRNGSVRVDTLAPPAQSSQQPVQQAPDAATAAYYAQALQAWQQQQQQQQAIAAMFSHLQYAWPASMPPLMPQSQSVSLPPPMLPSSFASNTTALNDPLAVAVPALGPLIGALRAALQTDTCATAAAAAAASSSSSCTDAPPAVHYELEARFGRLVPAMNGTMRFTSGVSREFFDAALLGAEACNRWFAVIDWSESHDFYCNVPLQQIRTALPAASLDTGTASSSSLMRHAANGTCVNIRSSVHFHDSPHADADLRVSRTHMLKTTLQKRDFRYVPLDGTSGNVEQQQQQQHEPYDPCAALLAPMQCDVRVALSREQTLPEDALPPAMNPQRVRIKQRKSFQYASSAVAAPVAAGGTGHAVWSFDFTLSWSGATKADAEQAQRTSVPVYELECECLDPRLYLAAPKHDDMFVARSLLLKMCNFLRQPMPSSSHQHQQQQQHQQQYVPSRVGMASTRAFTLEPV